MPKQSPQKKRPALVQKAQPEKTTKQIEADKKLEKTQSASTFSAKPGRRRVYGTD